MAFSGHAALVRARQPTSITGKYVAKVDVATPGKIVVTFKSAKPTNQKIFRPDPDLLAHSQRGQHGMGCNPSAG